MCALRRKAECGVTKALEIIGGKWTLLIIRDLLHGPQRFSDLESSLVGISPRTLAVRLKELESHGVLWRDCRAGPAHPVYRLTDRGQALQQILDLLGAWGDGGARPAFSQPDPP